MSNITFESVLSYWSDLWLEASTIIHKITFTDNVKKNAVKRLQIISPKQFAHEVMGLPQESDLNDVIKYLTKEQLASMLPSYAERLANWALKEPLLPGYFVWEFPNQKARSEKNFNNAKCLGIACCYADLVNLGHNGKYIDYTQLTPVKWVSYVAVMKSWGETPWA